MKSKLRFLSLVATACLLNFLLAAPASASHFRGGQITWTQAGGNSIDFIVTSAWRRSAYNTGNGRCINLPINLTSIPCTGAGGRAGVGDIIVELQGGTQFDPGDGNGLIGSPLGPLLILVTSVDPTTDGLLGDALDPASLPAVNANIQHTYITSGPFTAHVTDFARIGNLENNANTTYRIETTVTLVGGPNNSPETAIAPIVLCPVGGLCSFNVPASDPDSDIPTFRFSTAAEAGGSFVQPAGASIDTNTGLYTWDNTASGALVGQLFSTQVTILDGTDKIAVEFLIQIALIDLDPPVITGPSPDFDPLCDTTIEAQAGSETSFDVLASDPDVETVTLNVAGLPAGATMTPGLPLGPSLTPQSTFAWTPVLADVGDHVVNFDATSASEGFTLCPVTISVVDDFVAAVEPAGEGPVVVFDGADDPENENPLNFEYESLAVGGLVTGACCKVRAIRESELNGRGRRLFFNARNFDIGQALIDATFADAFGPPFDPTCADLIPLVPVGNPNSDPVGEGGTLLRPWNRVLPDTALTPAQRETLYTSGSDAAIDARANLAHGVCVIVSTAVSDGLAVFSENTFKLVGYPDPDNMSDPGACDVDDVNFRGITAAISLDPPEVDSPFVRPTTNECDRSTSGRRSSTLVIVTPTRIDTDQMASKVVVSRLLGDTLNEVRFESDPLCGAGGDLAALDAKLVLAKDEFNLALKATKRLDPVMDAVLITAEFDTAIGILDDATCDAHFLPGFADGCFSNIRGLLMGRIMNDRFMMCSLAQHPTAFDADKLGGDDDCLINEEIRRTIFDVAGNQCPIG